MYAQGIESNFSRHEPCPKCKSKDNLGRYTDGHAWCFGCGYYERAERKLNESQSSNVQGSRQGGDSSQHGQNDNSAYSVGTGGHTQHWTKTIEGEALVWLRKYGITDQDILANDIRYDGRRRELILPLEIPAGSGTYQRRYFGPHKDVPKYITEGPRAHSRLFGEYQGTRCACMVEGVVDAIKIARVCGAYPILGSDPSQEVIKRLLGRFEKVVVWLDPDMTPRASRAVLRASMQVGGARVARVTTKLDPKCYNASEIKEILEL